MTRAGHVNPRIGEALELAAHRLTRDWSEVREDAASSQEVAERVAVLSEVVR